MTVIADRGKVFNGTTVELTDAASVVTVYSLLDYSGNDSVAAVDDKDGAIGTGGAEDIDYVEPGSKNQQVSFSIAGVRKVLAGKKYDVVVKSPSGTVIEDYGPMLCTSSNVSGSHNGEYKGQVSFQPTRSLTMPWASAGS